MPLLHRTRPADTAAPPAPARQAAPVIGRETGSVTAPDAVPASAGPAPQRRPMPRSMSRKVPVTRTSVAWAGVWAAVLVAIAFIVFLLQNTAGVKVSFLGMGGTLPLAAGLLIAMVAGVVLTLIVGTARITQLRHLARRRPRQDTRR